MFKFAESVPAVFPAKTAFLRGTVGPVVWAESPMLHDVNPANGGVMVALNRLEAWEFVKVALRLFDDAQRLELLALLDGVPRSEHDAAMLQSRTRADGLEAELSDRDTLAAIAGRLAPAPAPVKAAAKS